MSGLGRRRGDHIRVFVLNVDRLPVLWDNSIMKRTIIVLTTCLGACTGDFQSNSITENFRIQQPYKAVATCVANTLDEEPQRIGSITVPVTRSMNSADDSNIQLVSTGQPQALSQPNTMIWRATIHRSGDVQLIARRDLHPALSSRYVADKVRRAFRTCDLAS